jgi:hypothetical protein
MVEGDGEIDAHFVFLEGWKMRCVSGDLYLKGNWVRAGDEEGELGFQMCGGG